MKKLSLILALMFVLTSIFAGCGTQSQTPGTTTGATTAATENSAAEPAKDVTVKFLSWEAVFKTNHEAVAKAYEEKHPGVKVQFEYVAENNNADYLKKVDLMFAAGDATFDIAAQPGINEHFERAYRNLFEPLDDYLKAEGVKYDDVYTYGAKVNGKIYSLPGDAKFWFVMINKNMLDAANLPLPKLDWTWDDYRDYAKKLTKGEGVNKVYGSYQHTWDMCNLMNLYSTKIGNPYFKGDEKKHNLDDPNLKDWLQFRHDLEAVDKTEMPYFEAKSQKVAYRDQFFNQKAAMIPIGSWMIAEIKDISKYPHDFVTTFAALPRWKDAPEGRTNIDSHFYAVNKNSKNKQAAYDFLRFYTTDGMAIKGTSLTAQKGADSGKIIDTIIAGSEKLYDVEALRAIVHNPKKVDNVSDIVPTTQSKIKELFVTESEKYLVGGEKLDEAIANMIKQGNEIINSAK